MRTNLSLHNITADDLEAGGGTKAGLYVATNDGQISFGIDRVALFFDGPTEFAVFLAKLNRLAAETPCVVEAVADMHERIVHVPAEALANYEAMPMSMGVYCDDEIEVDAGAYVCTRPVGHDGDHAAHITPDMPPVRVWAAP